MQLQNCYMIYSQFTGYILRVQSEMTTHVPKHSIHVDTLPLHENTKLPVNSEVQYVFDDHRIKDQEYFSFRWH
jgi:hypothetical protein